MKPHVTISIDGPTASGKTTLGTALARQLGAVFLDTGLTYRAVALALTQRELSPEGGKWRLVVKHDPLLYERPTPVGDPVTVSAERLSIEGVDVTEDIFDANLDAHLKAVSAHPEWRHEILSYHKQILQSRGNVVAVGRDTATALLPSATVHVALTATLSIRRERRRAQYRNQNGRSITVGPPSELDEATLKVLRAMPNSIVLDTSFLFPEAVLRAVLLRMEEI
jgi:CMP/dCMP kinase